MSGTEIPIDQVRRTRNRYNRFGIYFLIVLAGLIAIDRFTRINLQNLGVLEFLAVAGPAAMIWVLVRHLSKYSETENG